MANVEVERLAAHAVRIWLNRPRALNALDAPLMTELDRELSQLESDVQVSLVVVQGRGGKAFSVGADLTAVASVTERTEATAFARRGQLMFERLAHSRLVTLAVLQGYVLGGGLELAMACDLRLATSSARLGLPETGLGLMPGFGGTQRLPRLVGSGQALWMLLSGERIRADTAERYGLVNWVVDSESLEQEILDKVAMLGSRAPLALAAVKRAVRLADDIGPGLSHEAEAFGQLRETDDAEIGIQAFLNRTVPKFNGT
jgi:enoyl-CoA hydratase/carnithine racemase